MEDALKKKGTKQEPAMVAPSIDGIKGFARRVLRYFQDFIETDFKRQQAPRRRVILKNDAGFRLGIPLRKYAMLFDAVWSASRHSLAQPFEVRIPKGRYTSPLSLTLRDLIKKQVAMVDDEEFNSIRDLIITFATEHRVAGAKDAEKFVDDVALQFVAQVGERIILQLLAVLEEPFRQNAYSAIESIYDIEADLTEAITAALNAQLPRALTTLIASGDAEPLRQIFDEFFAPDEVRAALSDFFEQFSTADVFLELRDLDNTLRTAEGQSLYLYMADVRFGTATFPLFYIPLELRYDESTTSFVLKADPHLYINKRALDWIAQEIAAQSGRTFVSPAHERIIYLSENENFAEAAIRQIKAMIPSLDVAANLDLTTNRLHTAESASVRMSNALYLAVFDKADESILGDYEALLTAVEGESKLAAGMFEDIIRSMILDEPKNANPQIDRTWDNIATPDRLIAPSPIPVNEEQRKIQIALNTEGCRFIVVQGPPGTGKSHTISALAFDAILSGKNILILSDKVEALDVVEDKLAATLAKVRHDENFSNPILRLGKSTAYSKLISASNLERIKEQDRSQRANATRLNEETQAVHETLRANVVATISAYANVKIKDVETLTLLERKIEVAFPGITESLQDYLTQEQMNALENLVAALQLDQIASVSAALAPSVSTAIEIYTAIRTLLLAKTVLEGGIDISALALFNDLSPAHIAPLTACIVEYENARWPVFGYFFTRSKARAIDQRLATTLPCNNALDLYTKIDALKSIVATLARLQYHAGQMHLDGTHAIAAYGHLAAGRTVPPAAENVAAFIAGYIKIFPDHWPTDDIAIDKKIALAYQCASYAIQFNRISATMNSAPVFDYVGEKSQLETLHASRMSREIDRKFVNFVGENRALAKSIGEVIKSKKQFPTNEFERFGEAFPCIIAGVRDYASYVPLKGKIFDIVVIDEASQVSLAQAFPALLRAKRVVVFGDERQFSNVKSQQASKERNATYLTEMETYFRRNISDASDRIERLKQFDVKKSVLDFFKLIANTEIMLKKHFRGYQELISFSSVNFYGGQLQAIKVRSKPLTEVLRFHELAPDGRVEKHRNANSAEAEFILAELRRMVDQGDKHSVGIITPFREQQEAISRLLFNDAYAERFQSLLRLKIMTFDSCQGEERDLIIYSMVATRAHDGLNYIFPASLEDQRERIEEALKVQRLNVGFSRAKEGMLFVLSKPVAEYKGSAGRAIRHFEQILQQRSTPTGGATESPMEEKVLQWVQQTAFYQINNDDVELQTQFPLGDYLRQLDPSYKHPAFRCDFLLTYSTGGGYIRVIIEYDGFAEHFVNRDKVTAHNYEQFYREEDIERQLIIEGYGYKFLRINRFNLGKDPVATLSDRLFQLVHQASQERPQNAVIKKIRADAEDLSDKSSKLCPKCEKIVDVADFFDPTLRSGAGGYGRVCMSCKRA
ncbi:AAA domain-containing protein [Glaciimonas immobilis]|uniref:AAA domain-containing protein n=1 Tax=Glaciimonas immobilis TaxID=728004 RepID=A0A840RQD3_9BURK|nr:AAA domain-containing protein [Glaciimonas immobilis]KAF3997975.1 hypothetical protein HAV38_10440 [Glaciimonas immobilis]MBB5199352.1 hypothetical protein [Glaciimonas immobilis]